MTIEQTLKMLVNALEECHKGLLSSAATGRPLLPAYLDRVTPAVGNAIEAGRAALAQMAKPVAAAQAKCPTCGAVKGTRHDKHCPHAGTLVRASETAAVPDEPDWDECIRQAEVATGLRVEQHTMSIVIREVRRWLAGRQAAQAAKPEPEPGEVCRCPCCQKGIDAPHKYHWERRPMPEPAQRLTDEQVSALRSEYGWAKETIRAIESEVRAQAGDAQDAALLRAIQRLNSSPYSLTKSECIAEIEAVRAQIKEQP